jgi:hypothetical protein
MSALSKFLYLFQCIPLFLPRSFFKCIDCDFISFIWNGKNPSVRVDLLHRLKLQGGLALPNIFYFYWAANVQKIMFGLHTPDTDWCHYEATSCTSTSLMALVTSSLPVFISEITNNPIVLNTLKIWFQMRRYFGFKHILSLSPICNNHLFLPAKLDATFSLWRRQGISKFKDM